MIVIEFSSNSSSAARVENAKVTGMEFASNGNDSKKHGICKYRDLTVKNKKAGVSEGLNKCCYTFLLSLLSMHSPQLPRRGRPFVPGVQS